MRPYGEKKKMRMLLRVGLLFGCVTYAGCSGGYDCGAVADKQVECGMLQAANRDTAVSLCQALIDNGAEVNEACGNCQLEKSCEDLANGACDSVCE